MSSGRRAPSWLRWPNITETARHGPSPRTVAMPHGTPLIATIVIGIVLAFAGGFVASRLRLPPLVGYLLAGVAVGPFTPGFVADVDLARQLAEIGVILLDVRRRPALLGRRPAGGARIAFPGALGADRDRHAAGRRLARSGAGPGAPGSCSGSPVGREHRRAAAGARGARCCSTPVDGRIAVGWLIVEDLAMVLALVLLPALAVAARGPAARRHGAGGRARSLALALTLGKVAAVRRARARRRPAGDAVAARRRSPARARASCSRSPCSRSRWASRSARRAVRRLVRAGCLLRRRGHRASPI